MGLTPALFTSAKPDGTDPTKLQPSYWNRVTALLNSLLNGAETHGSVLYHDTADATDGASYAASAAGVLACAGSGQAPAFRALATTDLPTGVPLSLFTSTTSVANVGTAETDLITYSLPGGTLSVNNQKVRITAWGGTAANANTKTIKIYFGAVALRSFATTSQGSWIASGLVVRTGASAQAGIGGVRFSTVAEVISGTSPSETLSGAVVIKVTGQSAVGSGDVTANGMFVEWIP
jgi:hypothetical protein